ncbi:hypothetical protein CKAH01_02449 [Colletotrichum kahawae]|uniref:Uncharacterized protein n=1 Tax=Colletotrichum kahawae TaxID=34407 RepID=A0AAE0CYU2_COLKA|nr:hypothetical protein CKAH01_02449 [Colletotrichum kahawae]
MVRALLIAALAAAALAIPVPVTVPGDGAYIPAAEELKAPAEADVEPVSDTAIPDAAELAGVDEDGAQEGDLAGENVSEPDLPVERRVVDTGDLDTSAVDTSALGTDSLDTSSLNTDSLSTDSLTTALPTSSNTKRSDGDIP